MSEETNKSAGKDTVDNQQENNVGGCTGKGWKPGQSGNPNGRPKKENTFSDIARELMSANEIEIEYTIKDKTTHLSFKSSKPIYYGVATALIKEALSGKVNAAKELLDRIEGKPNQSIDLRAKIANDRIEPLSLDEMKREIEIVEQLASKLPAQDDD